MKVVSIGSTSLAYKNAVFVKDLKSNYVKLNGIIFSLLSAPDFATNEVGLGSLQRNLLNVNIDDEITDIQYINSLQGYVPTPFVRLSVMIKQKSSLRITHDTLLKLVRKLLDNVFITKKQTFIIDFTGTNIFITVDQYQKIEGQKVIYFDKEITTVQFKNETEKYLVIEQEDNSVGNNPITQILQPDFSFEKIGVGGLDGSFIENFRRTFATRLLPASVISEIGVKHTKGMLLYGVPGCGKTRLARALSELIGSSETKVVNGPECLDRYVGSSEQKIRELFAPAEKEYTEKGDKAKLFVIIFDEIDAICKSRGSSPNSLTDSVVNQLLTKIDGVESVPNVFIIGMTNIPDVIDKALTRPGRLELKMEIGLPDLQGRVQILNIHTQKIRESGRMDQIDLVQIAQLTNNYTGAELESVVKNAISLAILENTELFVTSNHFMEAITKVQPNFGVPHAVLNSIITEEEFHEELSHKQLNLLQDFYKSNKTREYCVTECINDAALIAKKLNISHVKYISARQFLHLWGDSSKAAEITKMLLEANKSRESLILIDGIEKLCEYINGGRTFSSIITHTLSTWIKCEDYINKNKMAFLIVGHNDDFIEKYLEL